jgi:Zn ribbon nucleic-acid-binding protein
MRQKTIKLNNEEALKYFECEECGFRQHNGDDCYKCRCLKNEYHREEAVMGWL